MIQHLNGLIKASSGALYYNGENIYKDKYDMKKLRSKVGLVFSTGASAFEIDVLKYRGEAEFLLGDYGAAAYTYDTLAKVDKPRAEYYYLAR